MSLQSNRTELLVQRRLTKAYLDTGSTMITLMRPQKVSTPSGGRKLGEPLELPPQCFRIVPYKRRLTQAKSVNQEGTLTVTTLALVGYDGADVRARDYFSLNGQRYEVDWVDPNPDPEFEFRTIAVLTSYGEPDGGS